LTCSGLRVDPGANSTASGVASNIANPATSVTTTARVPAIRATKVSIRKGSACSRSRTNAGMKAAESAPSANSRRSELGMRNASTNASVAAPAPKTLAMTTSRTTPVRRDSSVSPLKEAARVSRPLEPLSFMRDPGVEEAPHCEAPPVRGGRSEITFPGAEPGIDGGLQLP